LIYPNSHRANASFQRPKARPDDGQHSLKNRQTLSERIMQKLPSAVLVVLQMFVRPHTPVNASKPF
jgi:hypothetical protein